MMNFYSIQQLTRNLVRYTPAFNSRRQFSTGIQIQDLHLNFSNKVIFNGLKLNLQNGDKVTIVGDNGSGKSTLIKLLSGNKLDTNGGKIIVKGKIAYLPQSFEGFKNQSTLDHIIDASQNPELRELIHIPFSERKKNWFQSFHSNGGNAIMQTFHKFGLTSDHLSRNFFDLSGGEKVKAHLSGLFHSNPEILLLDEPTNHLDKNGCASVEKFINDHSGITVMVTHDRSLINNTQSRISELCPFTHTLINFKGGYQNYLEKQREKYEKSIEILERQKKEIKMLRKQHDALGHAGALRARKKIKNIQDNLEEAHPLRKRPNIILDSKKQHQSVNLSVTNLSQDSLFKGVSFHLHGGERLVITGRNGAGKTTLLEILAGIKEPNEGSITTSSFAKIGFLDQEQRTLDLEMTAIELIKQHPDFSSETAAIGHLKRFGLYYKHDFFNRLADLSIGCRRKVQLAEMIAAGVNIILLDEPTNHLDLMSIEQVESQLLSFPGIVIAVSHDRHFIKKIASVVLELDSSEYSVNAKQRKIS